MLRMIFAALLAIFVLLAFSEFVGLVPDRLGSVGRMNDLLGVLAIFFVVLSFGAMAWPAAVNRFFRRPLEREYRKLAKRASRSTRGARAGGASRRGGSSPATEDSNHEAFYAHLTARICTIDDQADTSPARLIATARQSTTESAEWPWQLPELAAWAQHSEERLRSNIVIRFLLGERLATVSERLKTLRGYALSFPVAPPGLAEQHATLDSDQYAKRRASRALATAIEAHSGASLLATGLHTRAGVDTVRLWHSDSILSQQESGSREPSPDNYTEHHLTTRIPGDGASETTSSSCTWEQAMQESSYYLVGDRDNHVPIVDGVTVSENRWAGSVEFVLSTHSSCMAATDHSPFACKGSAAALGTGETPLWEEVSRVVKRRYTSESVLESNLAVHVAIVVTDEHNERHLVLVRRSNTFRFGNRMLTMPSETLTLAAGGKRGYTDVHGAPDLLQHAMSGVRTALGLELEHTQLRPSHVMMVNQRESSTSATAGRSQLVCTVGFTASVASSRADIATARAAASRLSQHGVQGVDFLPLGKAGDADTEADSTIRELLRSLTELRGDMDQMSTTAALVVAARLLGVERVTAALTDAAAAGSAPWWRTPWVDDTSAEPRWGIPPEQSRVIQPERGPTREGATSGS